MIHIWSKCLSGNSCFGHATGVGRSFGRSCAPGTYRQLFATLQWDATHVLLLIHIQVNESQAYEYMYFDFLSNHGSEEYTCVYRVRVHGNYVQ